MARKDEPAKTQASEKTTPVEKVGRKRAEVEQASRGGAGTATLLLVGALIGFGGLIIGGAAGYTLGRLRTEVEIGSQTGTGERAFLGVGVLNIEEGALVYELYPDGPAEQAGLLVGDIIVSVESERVGPDLPLETILLGYEPGDEVTLALTRGGKRESLEVTLGAMPFELEPAPLPGFELGPFEPGLPPDFEAGPLGPEFPGGATPFLGVVVKTFTPELADELALPYEPGVVIVGVEPDSPAAHVGLRERDVIIRADERRMRDTDEFVTLVRSYRPGDVLRLVVLREGEPRDFEVALGARPAAHSSAGGEFSAPGLLGEVGPPAIDLYALPSDCPPGTAQPCL